MDMIPMAIVDLVFLIILTICSFRGYLRGAYREIIPLISWVLAVFIGIFYSQQLASIYLHDFFAPKTANIIAEIVLIVVVLFIGLVCSYGLKIILICYELNRINRMLGVVISFARGAFICLLIIHAINRTDFSDQSAWHKSLVVQVFTPFLLKIDKDIYDNNTISYTAVSKVKDISGLD